MLRKEFLSLNKYLLLGIYWGKVKKVSRKGEFFGPERVDFKKSKNVTLY